MKKKLCITVISLLITNFAYSQHYFSKKGNILIGGFSIYTSDTKDIGDNLNGQTKRHQYGIFTQYGRFIKQNLAIGVGIGYTHANSTQNSERLTPTSTSKQTFKNKAINTELFIRKYYPVSQKFGGFISSKLYYQRGHKQYHRIYTSETDNIHTDILNSTNTNTIGLSAGFGIYYFILSQLSLSMNIGQVGIDHYFDEENSNGNVYYRDAKRTSFNAHFINNLSIDINYHF